MQMLIMLWSDCTMTCLDHCLKPMIPLLHLLPPTDGRHGSRRVLKSSRKSAKTVVGVTWCGWSQHLIPLLDIQSKRFCRIPLFHTLHHSLIFQGSQNILACKNRPQILSHWIQCGRKYESQPVIKDLTSFISAWRLWWYSLQPEARKDGLDEDATWPLHRVAKDGEMWAEVRKGSKNGFFGIVLTLSWWYRAVTTDFERELFDRALADVKWVASQMVEGCPGSKKRVRNTDTHESTSGKRCVPCYFLE
jgi:hypothetical protein